MIKLYPFVTYNDENDKEHIYGSKNYAGFLCTHCYHHKIFQYNNICRYEKCQEDDGESIGVLLPVYNYKCPKCGEVTEQTFIIDPNILPILALLNKKGYITKFSCEGHDELTIHDLDCTSDGIYRDSYSHAYVMFKDPSLRVIVDKIPLLGDWYRYDYNVKVNDDGATEIIPVEEDDLGFVINTFTIHADKATILGQLLLWTCMLPKIDPDIDIPFISFDVDKVIKNANEQIKWLKEDDHLQKVIDWLYHDKRPNKENVFEMIMLMKNVVILHVIMTGETPKGLSEKFLNDLINEYESLKYINQMAAVSEYTDLVLELSNYLNH